MPIKNTVLKALANAIRQAKRRNDPAAVDELEAEVQSLLTELELEVHLDEPVDEDAAHLLVDLHLLGGVLKPRG